MIRCLISLEVFFYLDKKVMPHQITLMSEKEMKKITAPALKREVMSIYKKSKNVTLIYFCYYGVVGKTPESCARGLGFKSTLPWNLFSFLFPK